jgi:L-alanine-DL-glutamate epimerase-like enolase superfamily enzyme
VRYVDRPIGLEPPEQRDEMKIKQVTPWSVSYPEPNDSGNTRYLIFCSIEADDGTTGWGEAITQFPESTRATAQILEMMGQSLIGADPMQNIAAWRKLHQQSWWYGYEGGPASFAISAIDIALWDLKGKLLGQHSCVRREPRAGSRKTRPLRPGPEVPRCQGRDGQAR